MANENFFPGQMPGKPLGTGEGESPLAKPAVPNMDVRTMASDTQSINTGSPAPKPYAPQAPENLPTAPASNQPFRVPQMDVAANQPQPLPPTPKKGKGVFVVLIVVIVIVGLAALGYFVVYPIFFAAPAAVENQTPVTSPEAVLPTPQPAGTNEETPAATSVSPTVPAAPSHASLFKMPVDATVETPSAVLGASLSGLNVSAVSLPNLAEIVYKDLSGNLIKFSDVLKSTVNVDLAATVLSDAFDDQGAAGLIYTDATNVRSLGFIAGLKSGEDIASAVAAFKTTFESAAGYENLFANNPGTAQTWKSSQVAGATDHRFIVFSNPGFSIDYGWVGNKLIIMTSFDGFKEAIKRL